MQLSRDSEHLRNDSGVNEKRYRKARVLEEVAALCRGMESAMQKKTG